MVLHDFQIRTLPSGLGRSSSLAWAVDTAQKSSEMGSHGDHGSRHNLDGQAIDRQFAPRISVGSKMNTPD